MKQVVVPVADGSEEMETVIVVDVLRRAGIKVTLAGLESESVTASRGIRLQADCTWRLTDPTSFDALVLPGGMGGTEAFLRDTRILESVRHFHRGQRLIGAICAAPLVLQEAGILAGRRATCHPGVRDRLTVTPWTDAPVVEDGELITSQGPGTAFAFSLALVRRLADAATAARVAQGMVLPFTP